MKKYNILLFLITLFSCEKLQNPEYLLDFDKENSAPNYINVIKKDAFSLEIQIHIPEDILFDGLSIYRANALSQSDNDFQVIFSNKNVNESESLFEDTNAVYNDSNFYKAVTFYKDIESFSSDTVNIFFQIDAPIFTLEKSDNKIQQSIIITDKFLSGIQINRYDSNDTIINVDTEINEDLNLYIDSLNIDIMSTEEDSLRGPYRYNDLKPNINYEYEAKSYQDKNGIRRYSVSAKDTIAIDRKVPHLEILAYSDSIIRLYVDNMDDNFDSLSILSFQDGFYNIERTFLIEDLVFFENKYIIDLNINENNKFIVTTKSNTHYTVSNSYESNLLTIPGFSLIQGNESGLFSFGCNSIDENCDNNEAPDSIIQYIHNFYLSDFEVSYEAYHNPSNWTSMIGSFPVDSISYNDAIIFCENLKSYYPNYDFFIPSEIQWEYAASFKYFNETKTIYPWGNNLNLYQANYGFQNDDIVGVGSYPFTTKHSIIHDNQNIEWRGLYDMSGNVMEWVNNCYNEILSQNSEIENCWKVVKGGAFWSDGNDIRTTKRLHLPVDQKIKGVGLRVAMKFSE